jgi:hypothetical protein
LNGHLDSRNLVRRMFPGRCERAISMLRINRSRMVSEPGISGNSEIVCAMFGAPHLRATHVTQFHCPALQLSAETAHSPNNEERSAEILNDRDDVEV